MKLVHILIVEDSKYSADLNVRELKRAGMAVEHQLVANRDALKKALAAKEWDIILCDNNMPCFNALQALKVRNELGCKTPFVIVSEDISEKDVKRAYEEGCCDFVRKENLDDLGQKVKELIEKA